MPDPEEQDSPNTGKNRIVIDRLHETFAVMSQRLTPEVEPATTYLLYALASTSTSSENAE
jgi:hypothetical protein